MRQVSEASVVSSTKAVCTPLHVHPDRPPIETCSAHLVLFTSITENYQFCFLKVFKFLKKINFPPLFSKNKQNKKTAGACVLSVNYTAKILIGLDYSMLLQVKSHRSLNYGVKFFQAQQQARPSVTLGVPFPFFVVYYKGST